MERESPAWLFGCCAACGRGCVSGCGVAASCRAAAKASSQGGGASKPAKGGRWRRERRPRHVKPVAGVVEEDATEKGALLHMRIS